MLIPNPPFDMQIDKHAELIITSSLAVIAALGVLYALFHWFRSGRPVVLLLFVAGGCMMVFEPMVDTTGGCWFPANSWLAFTAWGRPIPVWLCLAYFFYFGIASALLWMGLKRGMTRAQIWTSFIGMMIGDLLFESALLTVDPYTYYGHQPLWLANGFPLWWAAVNAGVPMVLGAMVYRFDEFFRGWRTLAIIPAGLTASAATNAAIGWPSWLVVNSEFGFLATQAGGVATFGFAFAIVAVIANGVARDVPAAARLRAATA